MIQSLEEVSKVLFKWFLDNVMKSNTDKCHLLVSTSNKVKNRIDNYIRIDNFDISTSRREKLLGVKLDHKLILDDHFSKLSKNAS